MTWSVAESPSVCIPLLCAARRSCVREKQRQEPKISICFVPPLPHAAQRKADLEAGVDIFAEVMAEGGHEHFFALLRIAILRLYSLQLLVGVQLAEVQQAAGTEYTVSFFEHVPKIFYVLQH